MGLLLNSSDLMAGNKVLGEKVIDILRKETLKYGSDKIFKDRGKYKASEVVIAGAAVTTAVMEALNQKWIPTYYNDIDVFINVDTQEFKKDFSSKQQDRKVGTSDNGDMSVGRGSYGEIIVTKVRKYKVVIAKRDNLINKVFIDYFFAPQSDVNTIHRIVSAFDFNSVQVGIDLATGMLYGTPAFWKFLATKQFCIENLNTPVHTLIRFFNKKNEMGSGVYYDEKMIINACIVAIEIKRHAEMGMDSDIPLNFGDLTLKKLLKVEGQMAKLGYVLKEECLLRDYQTYTFVPNADASNAATEEILPLFNNSIYQLFKLPISEVISGLEFGLRGRKKDIEFFVEAGKRIEDAYTNLRELYLYKPSFFMFQKHRDEGTLKQINKLLEHRMEGHIINLGIDKSKSFIQTISPLIKKHGKLVYGILESSKFDEGLDIRKVEEEIKKGIESKKRELVKRTFESIQINEYRVRELITGHELQKEGVSMKHCVGGYANSVERGTTKIISFNHKEKDKRMTVEVRIFNFVDGTGLKLIQNKGYKDTTPSAELRAFANETIETMSMKNLKFSENNEIYEDVDIDEDEIPF